jgi:hypothetical protein
MPYQAPYVKPVDPGDRAGRTASPALLTVAKHLDVIKALGEFFIIRHDF